MHQPLHAGDRAKKMKPATSIKRHGVHYAILRYR
jgi:hypothetical protein